MEQIIGHFAKRKWEVHAILVSDLTFVMASPEIDPAQSTSLCGERRQASYRRAAFQAIFLPML